MTTTKSAPAHFGAGLLCFAAMACAAAHASTPTVTTFAGGYVGDGKTALEASFAYPTAAVADGKGNLFIADSRNCRVRMVTAEGLVSTFAGTGICGYSGDGGQATSAMVSQVSGLAFDPRGDLLLVDQGNQRIRKITPAGVVTTIAGNGTAGYSGDGGPATKASLQVPSTISEDGAGGLYIADSGNYVVRFVDATGKINTVAGNHTFGFSGDGGPATSAQIGFLDGVAADHNGDFYIADTDNARVRKVDKSGIITTYAGDGMFGNTGSGGPATAAAIGGPMGLLLADRDLFITTAGNIWVVHQSSQIIGLFAGSASGSVGFGGDGGQALDAEFAYPLGISSAASGGLLVADSGNDRVRTISGSLSIIFTSAGGYVGDKRKATAASLNLGQYEHSAFDAAGNLYIADGLDNRVRKVAPNGVVTTFAGTGISGETGDGGPATSATLSNPRAVAADSSGDLYIADTGGEVIRKVDSAGTITTFSPSVILFFNAALAVDASGNVYAGDGFSVVWKIAPSGSAAIVAGILYETGYNGDGIPATDAMLNFPSGVAVDGKGNLYISDWLNDRIRKVDTSGTITTVAGTGVYGFSGDGGPATAAEIDLPEDVALDTDGNFYIADWGNTRVRVVNSSGIIETIAGTGNTGYNGDGLPANRTNLFPSGVAVREGAVYVTDESSYRVRKVQ